MKYTLTIRQVEDATKKVTDLLESIGCYIINYSYSAYENTITITFSSKEQEWDISTM